MPAGVEEGPLVTVLMCVHNGGDYLRPAVASVLGQAYRNLRLLLIDDASTDGAAEGIAALGDGRVTVRRNAANLGLTRSLNVGLALCPSEGYIARMDADDLCEPERLARQVAFMEAQPGIVACGVWANLIDGEGRAIGRMRPPAGPSMAYRYWRPPAILHPAALIRSEIFKRLGYDESIPYGQDYDLFLRLARVGGLDNLPEYLLRYRLHGKAITSGRRREQLAASFAVFRSHFKAEAISQAQYESFLFEFSASPLQRWAGLRALAREVPMPFWYRAADNAKYALKWARARLAHG